MRRQLVSEKVARELQLKELVELRLLVRTSSGVSGAAGETPSPQRPNGPQRWTNSEVVEWFEAEGLGELSALAQARPQVWDGSLLFGLHSEARRDAAFSVDCAGVGVSDIPLQIKLKGALGALFLSE